MTRQPPGVGKNGAPSRAQIETLCILDAIGAGCYQLQLAERLGLSPELAVAVATSVEPLREQGWVYVGSDSMLSLTEAGRAWLNEWRTAVTERST